MTPIPTWKALLAFVPAMVLLWIAAALVQRGKPVMTAEATLAFGLAFFAVGAWCGWCAAVWHRLSPSFHRWWRPNSAVTAVLLAVIFCCIGGWNAIDGLMQLTK